MKWSMPRPGCKAASSGGFSCRSAQSCHQVDQIRRDRRFEAKRFPADRMFEREAICVKSLTLKLNRTKLFGPVYVPSLPNQRVAAKPGLNADLVALSRFKTHFDQGCGPKRLDHLIMTHSI